MRLYDKPACASVQHGHTYLPGIFSLMKIGSLIPSYWSSCKFYINSSAITSCINHAILIILYVYHHVIMIHIQFKFHEILFIGYLVTAQFLNFTLIKGDNSSFTEASMLKIKM